MNREEHLQFAKDRALEYCDNGSVIEAWTSFVGDMGAHKELANHHAIELGTMLLMSGNNNSVPEMRKFINGCN